MCATHHADPGKGVFETMLVVDGRPIELEAHLERLGASLTTLFGSTPPPGAREAIVDRARGVRHGKLRVTVAPRDGGQMEADVSTAELEDGVVFPPWERGAALRSLVVAGGLGAHKWVDRHLLERGASAGELPLVLDRDGVALEASRGSLFLAREGRLETPPADGRILPGIARRRVMEVAAQEGIEAREEALTLNDLRRGEVFLAGSVRGVEPVRSIDGIDVAQPGEITLGIAGGLRGRWLRAPGVEPFPAAAAEPQSGPLAL